MGEGGQIGGGLFLCPDIHDAASVRCGDGERNALVAVKCLDLRHGFIEIGIIAVKSGNDYSAGKISFFTSLPCASGAHLDSRRGVHCYNRGIHGVSGGNHLAEKIHIASLDVLKRTGVKVDHAEALELLLDAGAIRDDEDRILIPPLLVEEGLEKARAASGEIPILLPRRGRAIRP
jgi:hypothetical protein